MNALTMPIADGWTIVESGQAVACFRLLTSRLPALELARRIEAFLASETLPELSAVKLVRSVGDFDPAMPNFVKTYLEHALASP